MPVLLASILCFSQASCLALFSFFVKVFFKEWFKTQILQVQTKIWFLFFIFGVMLWLGIFFSQIVHSNCFCFFTLQNFTYNKPYIHWGKTGFQFFFLRSSSCMKWRIKLNRRKRDVADTMRQHYKVWVNLSVYTQTKQYTPITSAIPHKGLWYVFNV